MPKGRFIVFEGTDGSGKATQLKLACAQLKKGGRKLLLIDLPQYGTKSAGPVEEYLSGKYGDLYEVSPYAASLLYAVDRFDASLKIRSALAAGKIVLANRYVPSNAAHQGAKIRNAKKRTEFLRWLERLEYGILKLPRPDLVLFLHVPAQIGYALVLKKADRAHLKGSKRDIHEADLAYLKAVEKSYLQLAASDPAFATIECAPGGALVPVKKINLLILHHIYDLIS